MKEHDEGTGAVPIITFDICVTVPPHMLTDRHGFEQSCWIVAAPFCTMGYVNGARYLTGIATPAFAKKLSPCQNILFPDKKNHNSCLWSHQLSNYNWDGRQAYV